jgi:cbb3-type cytochrome oxidase subunit 3
LGNEKGGHWSPFFIATSFKDISKRNKTSNFVGNMFKPGNLMKTNVLLLFLFFSGLFLSGQESFNTIQLKRDSLLEAYFAHRDTVTVRTWVNVITSNKFLEEIRRTDSILLSGKNASVDKTYQMVNDLQEEVDKLTKENQDIQAQSKILKHNTSFENTTFLFSILVAAIFLILFVILFFGYTAARRKAAIRDEESRGYLAELNDARDEIEKMQTTEGDLAHKLNLLESGHHEKMRMLLKEKSSIEDGKVLLENQLIEVKKAYDFEVVKRKEIESQMILSNQQSLLIENRDAEEKKDDKIRVLEIENEEVKRALKMAINTLENEVLIRKNAEDLLNALIAQLEKAGFLQPENHSLLNISDQMKSYQNLLDDNKSLSNDVTRFRLNYENELKIKQQMKEDLAQIITKIKTNVSE